ncbi:MAG: hypothetical protein LKF71_00840 [Oscillospiraceae bacterium]|jgi:sporulation integral membrane protein YlbJ|nr:hypothetical protein [Oscillospiraceae bacterium]
MSKKIAGTAAILLAAALLIFPRQASEGASAGIATCLGVLIPSLYPFLVITVFLIKSGISSAIGRRIGRPFARLFALPPTAAPAILMGMIGGYPTGSRGAEALYESGELTKEQAERLVLFSVNGGPAFICTAVGLGFIGSVQAGRFLLLVHLLSGLAVGVLIGLPHHRDAAPPPCRTKWPSAAKSLLISARDGASSMLLMCCFVILFSTFLCILQRFFSGTALAATASVCEVTLGCRTLASVHAPLWCFSLVLGWGGLCVHLQVLQGLSFPIRIGKFFLCRALQGGIAALITLPFQAQFASKPPLPPVIDVFGSFAQSHPEFSGGTAAGIALVILCVALLIDSGGQHDSVV